MAESKRYHSDAIDVTYDVRRCIHAAECVRGLPAVFNTQQRPWIQPAAADADAIAAVVQRCPTGALHFARHDGGAAEQPDIRNTIDPQRDGPYYVRGSVTIQQPDGTTLTQETRAALCRCGASQNKPFCDNSHRASGFQASSFRGDGELPVNAQPADADALTIIPSTNGPLLLRGAFELVDADGVVHYRGRRAALCRCGGSANKPFCDGSHARNGFQSQGQAT